MKILFPIQNLGVEKTTIFIETVKALSERGAEIHLVIANQPERYVRESYYDKAQNIKVDVLESVDDSIGAVGGLKKLIKQYRITERVGWVIFSFFVQWRFWINCKLNRKNSDYIFETFLSAAMRNFEPKEQYDYIWTTDEYSLLWAEWINRHAESKCKIVHHSYELYWEHYSLPTRKTWKHFEHYALFEEARQILQKVEMIIIQDEERWNALCKYTGLKREREKYFCPLSIKDYSHNVSGSIYKEMNVDRSKKIIFYPTFIAPERGILELVRMARQLNDDYVTVLHGFSAVSYYLEKIKKDISSTNNVVISNVTLQYQQLIDMHSDVWCVFLCYGEEDDNNKYIVNSSNKLVMALQAGKPIITLGNQSLVQLCMEYECGIAINGWGEEFADAVHELEKNYDFYCKNARKCYEERFNIKPYADQIYDRLLTRVKKGCTI